MTSKQNPMELLINMMDPSISKSYFILLRRASLASPLVSTQRIKIDIIAPRTLAKCHPKLTCLVEGLEVSHIASKGIMKEDKFA